MSTKLKQQAQSLVDLAQALADHAKPIADERDEYREALEAIIAQWDTPNWKLTEPTGAIIAKARAILAKYPKP